MSGSLERVCLPVVGTGYSSERVHLSGSAYQLVRLDTVLSGCTRTGVLTSWWAWIQFYAGALEAGLDTVLSGCTRTGVLTSLWAWIQF